MKRELVSWKKVLQVLSNQFAKAQSNINNLRKIKFLKSWTLSKIRETYFNTNHSFRVKKTWLYNIVHSSSNLSVEGNVFLDKFEKKLKVFYFIFYIIFPCWRIFLLYSNEIKFSNTFMYRVFCAAKNERNVFFIHNIVYKIQVEKNDGELHHLHES